VVEVEVEEEEEVARRAFGLSVAALASARLAGRLVSWCESLA